MATAIERPPHGGSSPEEPRCPKCGARLLVSFDKRQEACSNTDCGWMCPTWPKGELLNDYLS